MAINQEMPEDVLILILSRLPVKSLIRFKSVSKHWYSLIQNPSFISLHNNRSRKHETLLVERFLENDAVPTLSLVSNETHFHDLCIPFASPQVRHLNLFGCSNGVICLGDSASSEYMLWNPAMREFRALPQPPYHTWCTTNLGFAFDPKADDYKVLRVAAMYECVLRNVCYQRVQIYNMSTDSWREIIATLPNDSWPFRSTWLDGVLYWVAIDPNGGGKIIAFHMFDELLEQVFLHKDIRINWMSRLCVLTDSLALVTSEFDCLTTESCLDIWVRDGNGVKDPWNKTYSIGPILGLYDALGFQQNGELLLLEENDFQMVSYNLGTKNIKEYDLTLFRCQVLSYTESLVSVKRHVY